MPKHARTRSPRTLSPRTRRTAALAGALTATVAGGLLVAPQVQAADATCSLSGRAFADSNRNGVLDAGEQPRASDLLYVFTSAGGYVLNTTTDAAGAYSVPSLPCGSYDVQYAASSWWPIRGSLTPTTTGSLLPRASVSLTGAGTADFGWRPITRSSTAGAPLDSYVGPEGLRVESYDDVVPAKAVYDAALRGAVGAEAKDVTIRFDLASAGMTNTSISSTSSGYSSFSAVVYVDFVSWLDTGDKVLSHEYGHAWSLYRAYLLQQDPTMQSYLQARGLAGDPRVNGSYAWSTAEMVAEDYRQLLGSPTAQVHPQANADIPPAASVPGLREFLLGAFSTSTTTSPSPSPSSTASPAPSPTASPAPSPTATTSPSPSPSPTATRTKGGGRRK